MFSRKAKRDSTRFLSLYIVSPTSPPRNQQNCESDNAGDAGGFVLLICFRGTFVMFAGLCGQKEFSWPCGDGKPFVGLFRNCSAFLFLWLGVCYALCLGFPIFTSIYPILFGILHQCALHVYRKAFLAVALSSSCSFVNSSSPDNPTPSFRALWEQSPSHSSSRPVNSYLWICPMLYDFLVDFMVQKANDERDRRPEARG